MVKRNVIRMLPLAWILHQLWYLVQHFWPISILLSTFYTFLLLFVKLSSFMMLGNFIIKMKKRLYLLVSSRILYMHHKKNIIQLNLCRWQRVSFIFKTATLSCCHYEVVSNNRQTKIQMLFRFWEVPSAREKL